MLTFLNSPIIIGILAILGTALATGIGNYIMMRLNGTAPVKEDVLSLLKEGRDAAKELADLQEAVKDASEKKATEDLATRDRMIETLQVRNAETERKYQELRLVPKACATCPLLTGGRP
jgi:predicted Zn-ribbon and HTH transcriptional regulator